jgi:hypothetical protein
MRFACWICKVTRTHAYIRTCMRSRSHTEIGNTYFFSTATMVSWLCMFFMLYVHCPSLSFSRSLLLLFPLFSSYPSWPSFFLTFSSFIFRIHVLNFFYFSSFFSLNILHCFRLLFDTFPPSHAILFLLHPHRTPICITCAVIIHYCRLSPFKFLPSNTLSLSDHKPSALLICCHTLTSSSLSIILFENTGGGLYVCYSVHSRLYLL